MAAMQKSLHGRHPVGTARPPEDVIAAVSESVNRGAERIGDSDNACYRKLLPLCGTEQSSPVPYPETASVRQLRDAQPLVDALIRRGDSPHTRRAYRLDLRIFADWLEEVGLGWDAVTSDELDHYREWLAGRFARTTANRRLVIVRALYAEAHRRGIISDDPSSRLRGVRGRDERDGGALTRQQARDVLEAISGGVSRASQDLPARRDLAILSLLLRTGLRRSEAAALRVCDMGSAQGHSILTITAKGNVTRTIKLPTDVRRTIDAWLVAAAHAGTELNGPDPVFVQIRRGGHIASRRPLSDRAVYNVVRRRLEGAHIARLGPHGLRATFVTLALEGGAPLHLVQHAAGHADPRTTELYWKRSESLDDNAVDYVRL